MKEEQDYIQDIAEIRSMMERSSKFMSLSGLAGVMAGIYALAGAFIAYYVFEFNPDRVMYSTGETHPLPQVIGLASTVLILAVGTAIVLSYRKASKRGEKVWNSTSRLLLTNMSIPLFAGGLAIFILVSKGLVGLMAPLTLLFYGLAIYNAGHFTYKDLKFLGQIQIGLGLAGCWLVEYGLLLWAIGFGVVHIVYGIYMHYRYER